MAIAASVIAGLAIANDGTILCTSTPAKFEREVQHLLDEFWPEVERVAEALLRERTLSRERLTELLD